MPYLSFQSQYDKAPETAVPGFDAQVWGGYDAIAQALARALEGARVLTCECYPGVEERELLPALRQRLRPDVVINSRDMLLDDARMEAFLRPFLTDDRVRGRMFYGTIDDVIDPSKLRALQERVKGARGRVLVYGFGASRISMGDVLLYADMARWEIQLRQRAGQANLLHGDAAAEALIKFKQGYFVEWRMADRLKGEVFPHMRYYLDTNTANAPVMVTREALFAGLDALTRRPFRLVPYFDPGVWGGHWMQEVCGLNPDAPNYAWSFDGVPEENSLYFRLGGLRLETPAMNLVLMRPLALLGERCYARFGAEFPIRLDFLDTMGGQNLSLQVHPSVDYIKTRFGMPYTQDESYYILDAKPGEAGVYLGMKNGEDFDAMIRALREAQAGIAPFDAKRYINYFPAAKHDHFLIPAGTIHCSGSGCMVLEVSATPYIFTFKLWDWDRVDLNGKPRPIHIDDGERVIRRDRDAKWVRENLVSRFETLYAGADYTETRTGLHALEFIETRVYQTASLIPLPSDGEFAICNLVEGASAVVESACGRFEPFRVHYAETFILPAQAGDCRIRPGEAGGEIRVLRASVRHGGDYPSSPCR